MVTPRNVIVIYFCGIMLLTFLLALRLKHVQYIVMITPRNVNLFLWNHAIQIMETQVLGQLIVQKSTQCVIKQMQIVLLSIAVSVTKTI